MNTNWCSAIFQHGIDCTVRRDTLTKQEGKKSLEKNSTWLNVCSPVQWHGPPFCDILSGFTILEGPLRLKHPTVADHGISNILTENSNVSLSSSPSLPCGPRKYGGYVCSQFK